MKGFIKLFALASLSAVALAHTASAQEVGTLKVNVPFDFTVENVSFPAGTYSISAVRPENMVRIQSADGRNSAIVRAIPGFDLTSTLKGKAVFHRFGDEYFLTQVWGLGNTYSELYSGKRAQQLEKVSNQILIQTATVVTAP